MGEKNTSYIDIFTRVSDYLKELREKSGLSIEGAGEKTQLHKNTIYFLESKRRQNIDLSTIWALAELYGLTLGEFFQEIDRGIHNPSPLEERFEKIGKTARQLVASMNDEDLTTLLLQGVLPFTLETAVHRRSVKRIARQFLAEKIGAKISDLEDTPKKEGEKKETEKVTKTKTQKNEAPDI